MSLFFRPGQKLSGPRFNRRKKKARYAKDEFLTPETIRKLGAACASGIPLAHARQIVGLPLAVIREWLLTGARIKKYVDEYLDWPPIVNAHEQRAYELACTIDDAQAIAVGKWVRRIDGASKNNWHAAAWLLEKTATEFARRDRAAPAAPGSGEPESARVVVYLPHNGREPLSESPAAPRTPGQPVLGVVVTP